MLSRVEHENCFITSGPGQEYNQIDISPIFLSLVPFYEAFASIVFIDHSHYLLLIFKLIKCSNDRTMKVRNAPQIHKAYHTNSLDPLNRFLRVY